MERPESTAEVTSAGDTLVSQVMPLLGITPSKNTQLQNSNTPEDIADIYWAPELSKGTWTCHCRHWMA